MAAISAIIGGIAAAAAIAGTTTSIVAASRQSSAPKQKAAPVYNPEAEKQKTALQESEANRRRVMSETKTVQTSALGNVNGTQTQKKTLLGG